MRCIMKNKAVAALLIFCLLASNFSRVFVYAGFELNRKYIAANLCENRDKPWLHCNGKCYFMKKIKQAEEKQKAAERQDAKNMQQEVAFERNQRQKFFTHLIGEVSTIYLFPKPDNRAISIFQPPRFC